MEPGSKQPRSLCSCGAVPHIHIIPAAYLYSLNAGLPRKFRSRSISTAEVTQEVGRAGVSVSGRHQSGSRYATNMEERSQQEEGAIILYPQINRTAQQAALSCCEQRLRGQQHSTHNRLCCCRHTY
jgi:hypothetical protein